MERAENFIEKNNLLKKGEVIGVGCSGGSDSVALLHFLAQNQRKYGIKVVAIHIDHQIRENSEGDCQFVREFANALGVRFYRFAVDVPSLAKERAVSLETAGRESRYNIFKLLIEKGIVDKVALAHHMQDQAETILMHIFRGCGLSGARGMEPISENIFIRPFLDTKKEEILQYIKENNLNYVEDYTNADTSYARNFVRNVVLKEVTSRWPKAVEAIVNFGKCATQDDDFINSQIFEDAVLFEDRLVKIPTTYFLYGPSIISRLILRAFHHIGIDKDIERRHIALITNLALQGENGSKLSLPYKTCAVKEYEYITIYNRQKQQAKFAEMFGVGEITVPEFGKISIRKCKSKKPIEGELMIDADKLPLNVQWRFRQEGDEFVKFGSGRKKLKNFLINKKVPARERATLPLLASGSEVYVVAGMEISESVKVDQNTKNVYRIKAKPSHPSRP